MEMFERTFAMFAPFARKSGETPTESDSKEPKAGGDIDDLKRQIEEMQRRLDRLGDK
jgi:polyhydroxyalkanoate synthesis regulator protein